MKQDIITRRIPRQQSAPIARAEELVVVQTNAARQVVEIATYVFDPASIIRPIEALSAEDKVFALERALYEAKEALKAERRQQYAVFRVLQTIKKFNY